MGLWAPVPAREPKAEKERGKGRQRGRQERKSQRAREPEGATDGLFLYIGAAIPTTGPVPEPRYVFGTSVSAASAEGGPQEGATNQEDERGDAPCLMFCVARWCAQCSSKRFLRLLYRSGLGNSAWRNSGGGRCVCLARKEMVWVICGFIQRGEKIGLQSGKEERGSHL